MKLPQILAQTNLPVPRSRGAIEGGGVEIAAAEGIQRVGQAVSRGLVAYAEVEQTKQNLLAKQEASAAEAAIETGVATFDENLKLTERDPDTYQSSLKQEAERLFDARAQTLKTEPGKAMLSAKREQILGRAQIHSVRHANALYKTRGEALLDQTTADLLVKAGLTPLDDPRAFDQIERRGLAAIQETTLLIGEKEAGTRARAFVESLQAEQARRHREMDPQGFLDVADSRYPRMDATKRDVFKEAARKAIEQRRKDEVAEFEKNEKRLAKEAKEVKEDLWLDMESRLGNPERPVTLEELERERRAGTFRGEGGDGAYRRIRQAIESPKDTPSDRSVASRVLLDVESLTPRTTEGEIDALHDKYRRGLPGLSLADATKAKNQLRATRNMLREQGESEAFRQYNQAEQELRSALGIRPGLAASIGQDDPAGRIYAALLPELRERSWPGQGKEKPLVVIKDLRERAEIALGSAAKLKASEVRGLLRYPDVGSLDADRERIGEAAYRAQRRLFEQLDKLPGAQKPKSKERP